MKSKIIVSIIALVLILALLLGVVGFLSKGFKDWDYKNWINKGKADVVVDAPVVPEKPLVISGVALTSYCFDYLVDPNFNLSWSDIFNEYYYLSNNSYFPVKRIETPIEVFEYTDEFAAALGITDKTTARNDFYKSSSLQASHIFSAFSNVSGKYGQVLNYFSTPAGVNAGFLKVTIKVLFEGKYYSFLYTFTARNLPATVPVY